MITATRAHIHTAAATHAGMKGKNNEDRFAVSAHQVSNSDHTPSLLAMVCDGIGGHRAGEVAAELAVETVSRIVAESDAQQPRDILRQGIMRASQAIRDQSESDPTQQGMGATCVIAWVLGDRLYSASIGDSRLYLLRAGMIRQLTTDHTWVQEAIEAGALTPEQAVGHPNMHVIRRYLGAKTPPEPDFRLHLRLDESNQQAERNQGMRLLPGDQLILTSDGLTDLVKKEEIREALQQYDRQKALSRLIDLANARGGHDNITIVLLEVPLSSAGVKIDQTLIVPTTRKTEQTLIVPAPTKPIHRYRLLLACGGITVLLLLVTAIVVALGYFSGVLFPRSTKPIPTLLVLPSSTPKPSPTPSPLLPTPTPTETATPTPTATATITITITPTPSLQPSADTPTPTTTHTPTRTRVPITPGGGLMTETPTLTGEPTSTPTPTNTGEPPASDTPTSTLELLPSTPTPTFTSLPSTPTPTLTSPPSTPTPTITSPPPTPTPTFTSPPPPTYTPTIGFTLEPPLPTPTPTTPP